MSVKAMAVASLFVLPFLSISSAFAQPSLSQPVQTPGAMSSIGYLTARQLTDRCSDNNAANSSYCFAYIAAVADTVRAYEIWLSSREFCLPGGTAQADIRRAFMAYLGAYPDQGSGQAASVVVNALKTSYPCE